MSLATFNFLLGLGTLGLQVLTVGFLIAYLFGERLGLRGIAEYLARRGLWIGLVVTGIATVMSLVHSHVFNLPPCYLCWWQRIFIYPQVLLFALALWRKDASVAIYSIALSVIGLGFGVYHHALQMFPFGHLPCPAQGPSCSQILYLQFGYITYPMLAISLFAFLIVVMLFVRRSAAS